MKLGVNLSFAVKRWIDPPELAAIVREQLGVAYVQYTWDLSDPWWPERRRDRVARAYADAFRAEGLTVESTFGGLASYTYNNLLAPTEDLRLAGYEHLERAIDMTAAMEVPAAGMPLGGYSYSDAKDPHRREELYANALGMLAELARHARRRGLSTLLVEPTPLATEFPSSAEDALRLMTDLEGRTEIPVRLLVDWGHALYRPLFGGGASVDAWMTRCRDFIQAFHVQQTDGSLDCHWSFCREGLVTPAGLRAFWDRHGLDTQTFFLEIIYPFEADDDAVLRDMIASTRLVRQAA
ncbi:TIM barrel protein [Anaeromyxobacter oryzae]|uniref:Xylose isomerase n=1 Tax=Anaeromyxobacter oryzae TaxID=2918170 RepID=A0ABM7WPA3_9BACT|nr:TIM barrel protein [Anaeromyxobacter oryzae]BDG01295.1 xylose isomerase [Anaeromyxobacter oryzae]